MRSKQNETASEIAQDNPWMFRCAVGLAVCVLALIVFGASLTSELQPTPDSPTPAVSASTPLEVALIETHTVAAWLAAVLTLVLAGWLLRSDRDAWLRWLALAALAVVAGEGFSGIKSILLSAPRAAGFFHAVLAQILLSIIGAIAVGSYREPAPRVEDSLKPSLRALGVFIPCLALLQVLLGAAYRHGLMGFLLHVLNALIVTIVVFVVCMRVIQQFSSHPFLQAAALALIIVTGVQVILGFVTFILLLMGSGSVVALMMLSVAHVSTGALTLAASVVLAIQIQRYVKTASVTL
jgi:heme A synthase